MEIGLKGAYDCICAFSETDPPCSHSGLADQVRIVFEPDFQRPPGSVVAGSGADYFLGTYEPGQAGVSRRRTSGRALGAAHDARRC
jgi:hypothetical protein